MDARQGVIDAELQPWPSARAAWWAVFVFSLSLLVNFLDRGILTLLIEPIKHDLHLSDTQMSLVVGFAFVTFYMVLGLPIARLVDSGSRRVIIGVGLGLWSLMTAGSGLATNFVQLFAARVAVGVGEACTGPATYSMLADYFPRQKLPRAIAVLNFGFTTGSGLALIIGGSVIAVLATHQAIVLPILGTLHSWQVTLMLVGLPGLLVAALMVTVAEPARRGLPGHMPSIGEVARYVMRQRGVYVPMILGLVLNTVLAFGTGMWLPAFYMRHFGWSAPTVGLVQGLIILLTWPLGAVFGARLAEFLAARGHNDANMRVVLYASFLLVPGMVLFPLMQRQDYAVALAILNGFVAAWVLGPQNAALQIITPNRMRGQITALFLFAFNVVGFGLGPSFVAVLTDHVFGSEVRIGWSLATAAAILGPAGMAMIALSLKPYGARVAASRLIDA